MGPQRLTSSPHGRVPTPTAVKVLGHDLDSLLVSQAVEDNRSGHSKYTLSPWEISDTYSGLQMSAILGNTPKIKFLGIRFLRIARKSQHSLAGVVLDR